MEKKSIWQTAITTYSIEGIIAQIGTVQQFHNCKKEAHLDML